MVTGPHRPACPHRPECPGCPWLERPYDAQLGAKADGVRAALAPYEALAAVVVAPCVGAAQRTAYRTRTKWAVSGTSDTGARIGLYGPGHGVVDTPQCQVVPPAALAVAAALRRRPVERGPARLGALDVRCTAAGQAVVTLVVDAPRPEEAQRHATALADWLRREAPREVVGVAWSFRRSGAPTTLGAPPAPLSGETTVWDRIGLVETPFPPGAFSQVHAGQAAVLHELVRAAVAGLPDAARAHVVDLYAGTGGLGLSLAGRVARLTLVESFPPAAEAARAAAARLGAPAEVLAAPAEQGLAAVRAAERPLVVLADPPRAGLSAAVLLGLARLAPDLLVYVSCAPDTLARDLAVLATHGLRTAAATPVDLMPGTDQVEVVAALRPGPPPPPRVLAAVPDAYVVLDKPPFLPTVPHPEWGDSLTERARAALAAGLQPAHRLDAGTSGLVVFRPASATRDPVEGAEKTYLALARGITHKAGTIDRPLEEDGRRREARTRYRRRAVVGGHSLVEVRLETGRTHQIRRHFAAIGHPIVGDDRYGDAPTNRFFAARHGLIRPFLHAARIVLADGTAFESPLAPDLAAVRASLERE